MTFKKGYKWNEDIELKRRINISKSKKGKEFSEEHKKNLSLMGKGKHHSEEHIQKQIENRKKNGWFKNPEETKLKISLAKKEKKREPFSEETLKRMSFASKKRWENEEYRSKLINSLKQSDYVKNIFGENNPFYGKYHTKETKQKVRDNTIKNYKEGKYNLKPNNPEKIMVKLIQENNLPFNYVGDGKIWFRGENHSFNPDFLSKNPRHIIEVFGEYHHNLPKNKEKDKERIETYSKYGYKTLIIWSKELRNPAQVINKINNFLS